MWKQYRGFITLALIAAMIYGAHMLYRYTKVRANLTWRAAQAVTPTQSDDDAAEFGYIHSMRDELFLLDDNQINLVWFVKVPASGELFSCSYARGFPDFRRGNDVKLIRRKDGEAGYGYIVGLHDKLEGEAAEVWVINEMDIEVNRLEPDFP